MQDSQSPDNPLIVTSLQIDEGGHETSERSTQWVRVWRGFCETTTFHGLRNVAESTNNSVRRILWITIVLISILAYSYQCQHLLRLYLSWPVRMKITMSQQEKIAFPAICNINAFRLVSATEKGSYSWLDDMYTEKNISTYNYAKWGVGNQSMHDVYLQHAHRKEDMIVSCRWKGTPCSHEDFQVTVTDAGVCYTFNAQTSSNSMVNATGMKHGLQLVLNIEQYE